MLSGLGHEKTRPTLFLTTPVRIWPPMPPMPMFQPEDARLFAHFCLASRSLCASIRARQSAKAVAQERGEGGRPWVLGYARVCEADSVRDVEHEREDDDWHEAAFEDGRAGACVGRICGRGWGWRVR